MRARVLVAVLMGMFATPAYVDQYYVMFDRVSHRCLILHNRPSPGMRLLGIYKSEAEGRIAMSRMKQCKQ
jgi:hypothetical protein